MSIQTITLSYDSSSRELTVSSTALGTTADVSTTRFAYNPISGDVADIVFCVGIKYLRNDKAENPFVRISEGYAYIPGALMARLVGDEVDIYLKLTHTDGTVETSQRVTMKVVTLGNTPMEKDFTGVLLLRGSTWEWQSALEYEQGSVVTRGNRPYVSLIVSNVGHDPSSTTGYWLEITGPKGDKGDTGDPGILIDDGSVSTELTWSSSKMSSELSGKQGTLTFDSVPTSESSNPVTSGGLYTALQGKQAVGDYATNSALSQGLSLKANSADLATVATTGSYDDLSDKPTIPGIPSITISGAESESGKAIMSLTASEHTITAVKGTVLTEHQTLPKYNGSVMTAETDIPEVKTSAWDAKADRFVITASGVTASAFSVDKTPSEVSSAITNGKLVILNITTVDSNVYSLPLTQFKSNHTALNFENTNANINTVFCISVPEGETAFEGSIYDTILPTGHQTLPMYNDERMTENTNIPLVKTSAWDAKQDALGYTAENQSNKVASVDSSSTDTQYPTAKCLYTMVGNIESLLEALR